MNLTEKKVSDIFGSFVIEAYQRGYRWGKDEIEHLLNDIYEIQGEKYCLQPVVVKENERGVYELIDGQQRLTTIYLIMKFLSLFIDIHYSLEYTTRIGSKKLLETIDKIDLCSKPSNIDELFIKNAYSIIKMWFQNDKAKMRKFSERLDKVTIIWYEVDKDEDSVKIFTRLNIGKINLTNAELVKALFLSKGQKNEQGQYSGNPYGIEEKRQHEIALRWDAMEKDLHDEKFWAFITNEDSKKYPIRMELFFDMIEMKRDRENSFYTFNRFYEKFKKSDKKYETWELVERYMQQLKEWYNDFNLYHHIGFLVAIGANVKVLLDLAMSSENPIKKSEFRAKILEMIQQSMCFTTMINGEETPLGYEELNYEQHPQHIENVLLLFNVETIRQKGDENNRFPFDRYKTKTWSLEHIHAQNSESLKTNEDWKTWLDLHKKSLEKYKISLLETDPQIEKIDNAVDEINIVIDHINDEHYKGSIRNEFSKVAAVVVDIFSQGNDKSQMHTLSNMALLTVGNNAALSNSTFDVKRIKIIEMDQAGEYIPICTRNVFMKYYSESDTKLQFWSEEDRSGYINSINNVLYGRKGQKEEEKIKLIKAEIHYGN